MKAYTVSATFCEHFDHFDMMANSPEEAIEKFNEELDKRGHDPWASSFVSVREIPDTKKTISCLLGDPLPVWVEGRFMHGGAYNYGF